MNNALTIADEILKAAKRQGKSLTPMQLVKLTYIAHGWALAVLDRDLFSDRIEAWKYGPVIPVLYQATKHYGRKYIPLDRINEKSQSKIDDKTAAFLEDVVKKYGGLDAFSLSNLTHMPGTPWDQVYVKGTKNIEIKDDLIRSHYQEKLHDYNDAGAAA